MEDLNVDDAHLYFNITTVGENFGNHKDNEDVYFYDLVFINNCKIYPIIHYEFYENFYTLLFLYDVVSLIKYLIYDYKYHSITALHYNQVIPYLFQSVYH